MRHRNSRKSFCQQIQTKLPPSLSQIYKPHMFWLSYHTRMAFKLSKRDTSLPDISYLLLEIKQKPPLIFLVRNIFSGGNFGRPLIPMILLWAWQATRDRLPTNVNLHKRGILPYQNFLYCHTAPENLPHILYGCEFAKQFWSLAQTKHVNYYCNNSLIDH